MEDKAVHFVVCLDNSDYPASLEVDKLYRFIPDEIAAVEGYLSQLEESVSDVHSQMSDIQETVWGDVGLVTFVLNQTYKMEGQEQNISAPTSIVLRRQNGDWKVALIHTVPIPETA